jgi:hypothetical protein
MERVTVIVALNILSHPLSAPIPLPEEKDVDIYDLCSTDDPNQIYKNLIKIGEGYFKFNILCVCNI